MGMTFKHMLVAAVAACALSAGAAVAAPHGGWGGGEGMELLHSVTLTDAQKEQAHTIEKAAWASSRPIMEQLRSVHEQRATAMLSSGAVTAEALQPMVAQEETLRAQLDTIRLNTELQIRALLTPEQLAQAAATHAKLSALHEQEHAVVSAAHSTEQ
jgi:Spy/CpxP family protein refolding chaperone